MAYGGIAKPLKRALPLELSLVGTVALCALLYADREVERPEDAGRGTRPARGESSRRVPEELIPRESVSNDWL